MKIYSGSLKKAALDFKKTESKKENEELLKDTEKLKSAKKEDSLKATQVSLSSKARDFEKAKALALKEENQLEREKKIALLQKLIDEGKYQVDADQVAQGLLKEHLLMRD